MKHLYILLFSTFLAGVTFEAIAVEQDITFCYSCTESDKRNQAKAKLGYSDLKHVNVVNKATRQVYTYKVFKVVEPGLYQIFAQSIPTSNDIKYLIEDLYAHADAVKSRAYSPIYFNDLHFTNRPGFPQSAHDLVMNPNAQNMLNDSLSSLLSSLATQHGTNGFSHILIDKANDLIFSDLIGMELQLKFPDNSSVIFKFSDTAVDYNSKDTIIHVTQKPGSMRDNQGNTLFDSAAGFRGNVFGIGSGGAGALNLHGWSSMINRLISLGQFSTGTCYFSGENEVTCPYTSSN